MKRKHKLDLSTLDGRLLDGLNFCRKVYELFAQTRAGADGIANLRLRPTKLEKRLIEELIPIARYVQARYREGRRVKVRWLNGSQPYDAMLLCSGAFVDEGITPRRILVEVTTCVHPNEYLARQLLNEKGFSFGVKGISRGQEIPRDCFQPLTSTQMTIRSLPWRPRLSIALEPKRQKAIRPTQC